jgi:glycosyltransferase involved in cell wall biosynthesis
VNTKRTSTATFVMPFYGDRPDHRTYLEAALDGLHQQTDQDWNLVIVDDASPLEENRRYLREVERSSSARITVLEMPSNSGQGACRNVGVRWAADRGSEIILFHDADDVSHPRRLDLTRLTFLDEPCTDFVYSTFIAVDEHGKTIPASRLTPSIAEILEPHCRYPVFGRDAWIRMGTETGFTTPTTTVGVRTVLALSQPFAEIRGSEDTNTYFRMAAASTGLTYIPAIPQLYRIPSGEFGSSDRSRIGSAYYPAMAANDRAGFFEAIDIALSLGKISRHDVAELQSRFLVRLGETMAREGRTDLASELRDQAAGVALAGSS